MDNFLNDVLNQPVAMRKAMAFYYEENKKALRQISKLRPENVILTGMGSSHYCNQGAAILLNQAGIPARMDSASEILHYEINAVHQNTLLILVSQSGESGEVADIIHRISPGQTVIGVTNNPDSTLGKRADFRFLMHVEPEESVSTRTYLASLILVDMIANALTGNSPEASLTASQKAVDALEAFLKDEAEKEKRIEKFLDYPLSVCYIGRGYSVATAESGALFTRETAKAPALAFDSGEFRHGPYEMVDDNFRAVVFAPEGKTLELQKNIIQAITSHGGRVIAVTDSEDFTENERLLLMKHEKVSERYAPLVEVAVPQMFAHSLALHRGFVPGKFRQSSKITTEQ